MAIEFKVAAREHEAAARSDEDVVEVPIDGTMYYARRPTVAQAAALNAINAEKKGYDRLTTIFYLIKSLIGEDGLKTIQTLIWERRIDYTDLIGVSEQNPSGGLIDQIFAEFSNRPTQPSDDSSPSPAPVGRRSTGRSPGKGSTRSTSASPNSSTSSTRGRSPASAKKSQ